VKAPRTMIHLNIHSDRLADFKLALNRALNTWDEGPQWLFELADQLEDLDKLPTTSVEEEKSWAEELAMHFGFKHFDDDLTVIAASTENLYRLMKVLGYSHRMVRRESDPTVVPCLNTELIAERDVQVVNKPPMVLPEPDINDRRDLRDTFGGETDLPAQLPEWADFELLSGTDGYQCQYAQLLTRDGRRMGNAVITDFSVAKHGLGTLAHVVTDMGNTMRMTRSELEECFYPPRYIMKPEAVGVRLSKGSSDHVPKLDKMRESVAKANVELLRVAEALNVIREVLSNG